VEAHAARIHSDFARVMLPSGTSLSGNAIVVPRCEIVRRAANCPRPDVAVRNTTISARQVSTGTINSYPGSGSSFGNPNAPPVGLSMSANHQRKKRKNLAATG